MPDLKLYTIKDLRNWLINNNPPIGLNEHVIAPVRAYAILNNPYVKDTDAVVAVIYEGDELAAFTAAFPDKHEGKRIWWASTLWCNPKSQGKGYGLIVIGSLMEAHEGEVTLDRWGAQETVEIFKCLGCETIYTPRYILGDKQINHSTIKGKLAYTIQECIKCFHCCNHQSPITNHKYLLKYSTFIDGEAYAFMHAYRNDDLFLREQKMLNWILRYPFMQGCTLISNVETDNIFSSNIDSYGYSVVKVYCEGNLVGVYILRNTSGVLSVVSIYYDDNYADAVFTSILNHFKVEKVTRFVTEDMGLADFIKKHVYFPSKRVEQVSFSTPYPLSAAHYTLQLIDGDSFA